MVPLQGRSGGTGSSPGPVPLPGIWWRASYRRPHGRESRGIASWPFAVLLLTEGSRAPLVGRGRLGSL